MEVGDEDPGENRPPLPPPPLLLLPPWALQLLILLTLLLSPIRSQLSFIFWCKTLKLGLVVELVVVRLVLLVALATGCCWWWCVVEEEEELPLPCNRHWFKQNASGSSK